MVPAKAIQPNVQMRTPTKFRQLGDLLKSNQFEFIKEVHNGLSMSATGRLA
jgi:hypothetical protein